MKLDQLYTRYLAHPIVTTDTRNCPAGSLFFALKGTNFDGNKFALDALAKGCAYAVVDDEAVAQQDERCCLVDDVLTTLQQLAALHRQKLNTPILQITGTNGKTTTKELIAAVLQQTKNVLFTAGNLNNHIGVPLTLLRLREEHEFAVIETGANHPGEIAELTAIVEPNCGLITNVGRAHLEGFGSFEGVIKTKTELYHHLLHRNADLAAAHHDEEEEPLSAFIFCNGDDTILMQHAEGLPVLTYGKPGEGYTIEGEITTCSPFLGFRWRTAWEEEWHEVQTQLIGAYNLANALAAVAVGTCFQVPPAQIDHALTHYTPTNNRSEFRQTAHNRLVVDAYNANPSSMKAALENFTHIDAAHKMIILGEMRELGEDSRAAHEEVVRQAEATGSEAIWLVGEAFAKMEEGKEGFRHFTDVEAVKAYLAEHPLSEQLVLIKGSNGTRLFQLPALL